VGDAAAGQRLVDRLAGTALSAEPGIEPLLRCIGSHSPYLADLAGREHAALREVWRDGPDAVVAATLTRLRETPRDLPRAVLMRDLRAAKRVVALAVAVADLAAIWTLDQVTAALSGLAEAALRVAVAHLLGGNPDGSGFVVLAMGKLGARELNYSSDVDLVLLHDPQVTGASDGSARFTRMARDIVALMETRDQDGYVFRTDLRLRPDPAATPLCVALPTALAYYESMAQTWERAAMIKARPVAGDLSLGRGFLDAIRSFVWRRSLDFSAIADLHAMKRRIDARKGHVATAGPTRPGLAGHDVKLGRGGIREIEFITQTMQLVWGGRDPGLRMRQTVPMLRRLARAGHLRPRAAGELIAAYQVLRRVEHRLQMVADRQTHALPSAAALPGFARFMGFADPAAFEAMLRRHLGRVERRYADVFAGVAADPNPVDEALLARLGFTDPDAVLARIAAWQTGEIRALRSERARALLVRLLPDLLRALARQAHPDVALARLDRFFGRLPAGVTLLALFDRNRALLDRLAAVLGAAPPLAEHLASTPSAIEGLLDPAGPDDPAALLAARLVDAGGLEEAIRVVQRAVREEDFEISLATLEGRIDADAAGLRRAALADAAIGALLPAVMADVTRRHGFVPGGGVAVVLLGKAGGREMMAGSDLDLMLIYDHPPDVAASVVAEGEGRSIGPGQWFVRLVHALVAALSAPDAAGALYAIDMRLRPSGNKGPVAVSLAAFRHYHRPGGEAWTWERMALTRARVVAGTGAGPVAVEAAIRAALATAGPPAVIRADAAAMRARMQRDAAPPGPPFALAAGKLRPGGLVDVEFIAQTLWLARGSRDEPGDAPGDGPGAGSPPFRPVATRDVLAGLAEAGVLPPAEAARLIAADHAWRTVLGLLRLTAGRDGADPTGAALDALLRAARAAGLDAVDGAGLHATLNRLARDTRGAFTRWIGAVEDRP
jgi:glutamate-ammonia-ligase adenylyltransferase